MPNYAELKLYFGLCNADFTGEGRFTGATDRHHQRHQTAMQTVWRYLQPDWKFGLHLGYPSFVRSEEEAKELIRYAEENIPASRSTIELVDCVHGKIRFNRNIRFDGYTQDREQELIERLKESGYRPFDEEGERLKGLIDVSDRDTDSLWREALVFH